MDRKAVFVIISAIIVAAAWVSLFVFQTPISHSSFLASNTLTTTATTTSTSISTSTQTSSSSVATSQSTSSTGSTIPPGCQVEKFGNPICIAEEGASDPGCYNYVLVCNANTTTGPTTLTTTTGTTTSTATTVPAGCTVEKIGNPICIAEEGASDPGCYNYVTFCNGPTTTAGPTTTTGTTTTVASTVTTVPAGCYVEKIGNPICIAEEGASDPGCYNYVTFCNGPTTTAGPTTTVGSSTTVSSTVTTVPAGCYVELIGNPVCIAEEGPVPGCYNYVTFCNN
jgi:hypothetical protein